MINLGEVQTLAIIKFTDFGAYLSPCTEISQEAEKVLLPKKELPENSKVGDFLEVFIYKDSEDRIISTTSIPPLTLGGVALLKVAQVGSIGAFLDWGLLKDLLLPFKEQSVQVHEGESVLVSLYIDKSSRLCATTKIYDYLCIDSPYQKDDKVVGTVYELNDEFGAFVAVDNRYSALIPKKELFTPLSPGDSVEARVTSVREDGKLNLSIREKVHVQIDVDGDLIYKKLVLSGGHLPYNDKSDPVLIKKEFNLSKNAFKRGIGRLLKEGKITISEQGIDLQET